jgi:hypothetical protein
MKTSLLHLFGIVLAVATLWSQSTPSAQTTAPSFATLSGIVIKESGSEPLKKAIIELIAETQTDGANYTAITAADGAFRIENISPGRYRLFVERTGYQEIDRHHRRAEGRVLTLTAGQELKDIVIRLQAAAVVEGRVTDEDGDPMAEAQVAVLRRTFVAGRQHWEQAGAERSNDLGEYRIAGLAAGNYFVCVTPPPDLRSLIETANTAPAAPHSQPAPTSYQTTCYPGTHDRAQAASIQLHAGEDFPANFSLIPAPSLTIRGSVTNLPPGSTASVMLQSKDLNLMLNGGEMHKDGIFEIRDVTPGAYTILATVDNAAVPMIARQALQLTESVEGLRLAPQSGGAIRGRVRIEENSAPRMDLSQMFLLLRSPDGDDDLLNGLSLGPASFDLAHVNADGSFEWKNVPAGRYYVEISDASALPDYFLKSAVAGGHDVSGSGLALNGSAVFVELVASADGAMVQGVTTDQKNETIAGAVVVAVPEERLRGRPALYRKAVSDQNGRYTLRGLAPGTYTLFAWESVEGEEYYNPEFLKPYEGQGKAVHVAEGAHITQQLPTIAGPED